MASEVTRERVLLSLQRALLGEVFERLIAVCVDWHDHHITIYAYVDGDPTDDELESLSCVETEVIADFSKHVTIEHEVQRLDSPRRPPDHTAYVYLRKEVGGAGTN